MSGMSTDFATPFSSSQTRPRRRLGLLYTLAVPLLAGVATCRGPVTSLAGMNYTGYLWFGLLIAGMAIILLETCLRPEHRSYFPLLPWLAWVGYVLGSLSWREQLAAQHVREALQLCLPVLVGVVASLFVRTRDQLEQLLRMFCTLLPLLALPVAAWLMGDLTEDRMEQTGLCVEVRAIALTTVILAGLFLAGAEQSPVRSWIGWGACLAITVVTGSRMASAAMLLVPILNPVSRHPLRKAATLAAIALVGTGVYLTPIFQQRFFRGESGSIGQIAQGDFNSAGRFEVWPLVLEQTLPRLWLGHGAGSVQDYIPEIWPTMTQPHNEYLHLLYDLGAVGLAIFMSVLCWQVWSLGRGVRRSGGVLQQAFAAAWLAVAVLPVVAMTDNPLTHTLTFMAPAFALIGAVYTVAGEEQRAMHRRSEQRLTHDFVEGERT